MYNRSEYLCNTKHSSCFGSTLKLPPGPPVLIILSPAIFLVSRSQNSTISLSPSFGAIGGQHWGRSTWLHHRFVVEWRMVGRNDMGNLHVCFKPGEFLGLIAHAPGEFPGAKGSGESPDSHYF